MIPGTRTRGKRGGGGRSRPVTQESLQDNIARTIYICDVEKNVRWWTVAALPLSREVMSSWRPWLGFGHSYATHCGRGLRSSLATVTWVREPISYAFR